MPSDPTVHIVEDDAPMRDALSLLLRSAGFLVRAYSSAEEFLADEQRSRPLCLLVDLRLPAMDGLALHKCLVSAGAEPATVVITGHGDIQMAVAALKAGALDFVGKPFDPARLLDSVSSALQHAQARGERKAAIEEIKARRQSLTPREEAILDHLLEGHPSKVIAADLAISIRTVEHHRAHIMEKMKVRTFAQLIKAALQKLD